MKKYVLAALLVLGSLFCSCAESFPYTHFDDLPVTYNISGMRDIAYSDGYIYFANKSFNLKSGKLDTISAPSVSLVSKNMLFSLEYGEEGSKMLLFDIKKDQKIGETDVSEHTIYPEMWTIGEYLYFYEDLYSEETGEYTKTLVRWDTASKNVERYDDTALARAVFVWEDRIYFTDGTSIFSLDADLSNKRTLAEGRFDYDVLFDGEYIYYGVQVDLNLQEVYRMHPDGEGAESVGIICRPGELFVSEKYLYYKSYEEVSFTEDISLEGEKIYRCLHDGSEKETVCTFSGETANIRTRSECYVGNYIYALYERVGENEHYLSFDGGRYELLRIDMTTGETMVINEIETEAETYDE